jgi:hypothetical protein
MLFVLQIHHAHIIIHQHYVQDIKYQLQVEVQLHNIHAFGMVLAEEQYVQILQVHLMQMIQHVIMH